jgi:hypothetical protein
LQTKALQVAANIGLSEFRASNGWLEAFRKRHCIQFHLLSGETLQWTKMSSTTGNRTCPTLFKAMTQGISGTWTKLDFSGKVCQTTTWYCKEKSAKHASWPRRNLPLLFSVQQLVRSLSHWWLASCRCHELSINSYLVKSSGRQTPKHGWKERYFWNIFRNWTLKCRSRTRRPLFFSTMLLIT